jgi:septal ring factor EnvC (AmiA/AmiB activator)
MSDASNVARSLRERLSGTTEERLGKALSDLLENPLLTGAIGRAFDAREKAVQAQEVAMGVLNIPSAADIERLTRRLRSVSNRLEGIEDGVDRLDRAVSPAAGDRSEIDQRLSAIEAQLKRLTDKLDQGSTPRNAAKANEVPTRGAKAKTRPTKPAKA